MDIDNRNMDIIERLEELRDLMKQKEDWFLLQVAKDEIELLRKERDGLREDIEIWKSVFPDIAPESVQPNRSLLEKEIKNLRETLMQINIDCDWPERVEKLARAALKENS